MPAACPAVGGRGAGRCVEHATCRAGRRSPWPGSGGAAGARGPSARWPWRPRSQAWQPHPSRNSPQQDQVRGACRGPRIPSALWPDGPPTPRSPPESPLMLTLVGLWFQGHTGVGGPSVPLRDVRCPAPCEGLSPRLLRCHPQITRACRRSALILACTAEPSPRRRSVTRPSSRGEAWGGRLACRERSSTFSASFECTAV